MARPIRRLIRRRLAQVRTWLRRRPAWQCWGAVLLLHGLFALPVLLLPGYTNPFFPLSPDVLAIAALVALAAGLPERWPRLHRGVRYGALAAYVVVLLYACYDRLAYLAFRRSGLVAEDAAYVDDALYLAVDLFATDWIPWILGGMAAAGGLAWALPRLFAALAAGSRHHLSRSVLAALAVLVWGLSVLQLPPGSPANAFVPNRTWVTPDPTYRQGPNRARLTSVAERMVANVRASARMRSVVERLRTAPVDSTYFRFDAVPLRERPNVYLLMIESYGALLAEQDSLAVPFLEMMARVDTSLQAGGWHTATAYSDAPVRGGRSWLSLATVLTGTSIDNQLLYERFQGRSRQYPHLVRFMRRQGYETVTVQAGVRERPGLAVRRPYGFDHTLYHKELNYRGPPYGWGRIPDQYSLGYAHERVVAPADRPVFMLFESVDSHALWNYGLPPFLSDWRRFNTADDPERYAVPDFDLSAATTLLPAWLTGPRIYGQPMAVRYLRHIAHEWRVLHDYIRRTIPPNSLVLVTGDHQPPVLEGGGGRAVPMHVISRDAALVDRFQTYGFRAGLQPPASPEPAVHHAGLYSMLVDVLAAPSAHDSSLYRKAGISPSLLVQPQRRPARSAPTLSRR
jgi:hypothetical protein